MKKLQKKLSFHKETIRDMAAVYGGAIPPDDQVRPTDNLGTTDPPSRPISRIRF
jgi:hypothetical protein